MNEPRSCKTCGNKLVVRETQKKPSQLKKAYYYKAYFYCPSCRKIYHDEKFKVVNGNAQNLFNSGLDSRPRGNDEKKDVNDKSGSNNKAESCDVEIWTDGACVFNGQANAQAAWAFVSDNNEQAGLVIGDKQTNNVAEGLAILKALEWAVQNNFKKIKIYTDSQISLHNLKKAANKVKVNREIFEKIENIIKINALEVVYEKVLGHSGDPDNERADTLANELAASK